MSLSRRTILLSGAALGAAGAVTGLPVGGRARRPQPAAEPDPFTLGVASGDPDHDGFVLWTRLAPQPLAEDGLGGMPSRRAGGLGGGRRRAVPPRGAQRRRRRPRPSRRTACTSRWPACCPGASTSTGSAPSAHLSPTGRARTAPHRCRACRPRWRWPSSPAPTTSTATSPPTGGWPRSEPELILHLGDYQYEYAADTYNVPAGNAAHHEGPETRTLANYRQRHAQYKTDPDLQAAHAVAPWARGVRRPRGGEQLGRRGPRERRDRRASSSAARRRFRAYYENMPLRRTSVPRGLDMQLYRRRALGAARHLPHARHPAVPRRPGLRRRLPGLPGGSRPGPVDHRARRRSVAAGRLPRSGARGTSSASRSSSRQRDNNAGPAKVDQMDAWDGYPASRDADHPGLGRRGGAQPGGADRRRARALGHRPQARLRRPAGARVGSELVCQLDHLGRRRLRLADRLRTRGLAWNPHLRSRTTCAATSRRRSPRRLTARLPVRAVRHEPGARGVHPGLVRDRGPRARPAPDGGQPAPV